MKAIGLFTNIKRLCGLYHKNFMMIVSEAIDKQLSIMIIRDVPDCGITFNHHLGLSFTIEICL
jgi:hypothetical protein